MDSRALLFEEKKRSQLARATIEKGHRRGMSTREPRAVILETERRQDAADQLERN